MNAFAKAVTLVIAAAILAQTSGACADPTIARVGHGGITFLKSNDIRMLDEVLEISKEKIRVRYVFLNESDKDIRATVAFSLPSYPAVSLAERRDAFQQIERTFRVWANGLAILPATALQPFIGDRDVTVKLHKLGLSERQILGVVRDDGQVLQTLTAKQRASLDKLSQVNGEMANWTLALTLWWKQRFPAKEPVVIEQEYAPVSGRVYSGSYQLGHDHETDGSVHWPSDHTERACLDDRTRRKIEHRIRDLAKNGPRMIYVTMADVEYILNTGRNWKGPIGKFTLRIKKEPLDQFVSLCFPGKPQKVTPTEYVFVRKDYVPQDRLVVYFYDIGPGIK